MSKVGYRCPFCPKVRFTRCCPALRFWTKSLASTMFSPSFHVHEQGRVPMPVLPESRDRAFFLDLGIWYLFISHHSHMTIQHETQTLLHDCISQDRAFFHDLGICYLFNSHHWGLDISLVHDLGKSQ